jgi:hypothetical protein
MKRIGAYYREEVLSLPQEMLIEVELPRSSGEFKIIKDLFGWKLYSGDNFVECRSEEEARYLLVFWDAGMRNVMVPKEEEYLKKILPELERLKKRTDEIIEKHLRALRNPRLREQVRREVYMEITK